MPKKTPKNSFYFFMVDFKEEQRKKGVIYSNMKEVADAAGPLWPNVPPKDRTKYEVMARAEKSKKNIPELKYTSTGESLADIEAAERLRREAIDNERKYIVNFAKQKSIDNSILDEDIFIMDVNSYCKAGGIWLVGELTLLRFSLLSGVKDTYHENINPGGIPIGYARDVKEGSKELGLKMPDESERRSDYTSILANILDYLRRTDHPVRGPQPLLPPLYTMPDKVPQCKDFIQQLCSHAASADTKLRVFRLDTLFYQMVAHATAPVNDGFPKESLALDHLTRDQFKYSPTLSCQEHYEADKVVECTASRVKRWAFSIADKTCPLMNITPVAAHHYPDDTDLTAIQTYREERRRDASHLPPDDPSFNSSYSASEHNTASTSRNLPPSQVPEAKRTHVPQRMPTINYSKDVRAAPDLTVGGDEDFPPLGARRSARGRGRGLAANLHEMRL